MSLALTSVFEKPDSNCMIYEVYKGTGCIETIRHVSHHYIRDGRLQIERASNHYPNGYVAAEFALGEWSYIRVYEVLSNSPGGVVETARVAATQEQS